MLAQLERLNPPLHRDGPRVLPYALLDDRFRFDPYRATHLTIA
jgi:hypothetical protein